MKVATITFGYSQNLGALLQAYALREYIEKLGHQCEIIKFRDFDNRPFETIKGITDGISDIIFFGKCKKKIKKINVFRDKYLKFTDKTYYSSNEMVELNDKFDVFIAGSDQIWNPHRGIIHEFFLPFVKNNKYKMAYSASFGLSNMPDEYKNEIKNYLKKFDAISIREHAGVKIAKELMNKNYPQTLDPVFLKPQSEWKKMFNERIVKDKYIFVYPTQITKELTGVVKNAKKKLGCKVYSLFYFLGVDKVIKDCDPLDFLNYINYAELIIASSFHATAFSIIFNKNLRVIPHTETGSRVIDLLNDLKLNNCIIEDDVYDFDNINYQKANLILKDKIADSKRYIEKCLNAARGNKGE